MPPRSTASSYVAQAYTTRIIGYVFILLIIISTIHDRFDLLRHGPFIALCFVLPHVLYGLSRVTDLKRSTEWAEYIDIMFLGFLQTYLDWGLFPLLFIATGICVSSLMTLGIWFLARGMAVLAATIAVSSLVNGFQFSHQSNLATALVCSLGILAYASAIGLNAFNQRAHLRRTRRELKEQKEKIEALATKLSKYLSPQVYRSIFAGEKDVRIESYKKPLTILFSDIVGFTGIAESMEREQLAIWLNNYFNEMSNIAINRYSGTLDKYIGDSLMVFFGDPQSLGKKQDAIQCMKMAIEMVNKCATMDIAVRVGVHTGDCTVGNFGSDDRLEYTIVGGSVNLASRLETNSEAGRILISDSTYELIKDEIPCVPRGKIRVKGIDRDISTYWVAAQENFALAEVPRAASA